MSVRGEAEGQIGVGWDLFATEVWVGMAGIGDGEFAFGRDHKRETGSEAQGQQGECESAWVRFQRVGLAWAGQQQAAG